LKQKRPESRKVNGTGGGVFARELKKWTARKVRVKTSHPKVSFSLLVAAATGGEKKTTKRMGRNQLLAMARRA